MIVSAALCFLSRLSCGESVTVYSREAESVPLARRAYQVFTWLRVNACKSVLAIR